MAKAKKRIPLGTPGYLTRRESVLIFSVPTIALVILVIGVFINGRAEAQRDRDYADTAIEAYIVETLAEHGPGSVAADPGAVWLCTVAQRRIDGKEVAEEPYKYMSRGVAERFVRELC